MALEGGRGSRTFWLPFCTMDTSPNRPPRHAISPPCPLYLTPSPRHAKPPNVLLKNFDGPFVYMSLHSYFGMLRHCTYPRAHGTIESTPIASCSSPFFAVFFCGDVVCEYGQCIAQLLGVRRVHAIPSNTLHWTPRPL